MFDLVTNYLRSILLFFKDKKFEKMAVTTKKIQNPECRICNNEDTADCRGFLFTSKRDEDVCTRLK
jgi:hypothetical protein